MIIDMHNHTNISSPCSVLYPEELIENAKIMGLDGICVTEHLTIEGATVAQDIGRKMNFPVFRGIEARSDLGDMLVFGYYKDIPDRIALENLCDSVHEAGGVVFAAHPYSSGGWNLYNAMQELDLDLDSDWDQIRGIRGLDGIEIINGSIHDKTNKRAKNLAEQMNIYGIGGSDAHSLDMIARAATIFKKPIRTDAELVNALKTGDYDAVYFR